jgi:hypothetical protein
VAITTIVPVDLAVNVVSADLPDAGMTAITDGAGLGAEVDLSSYGGRIALFKIEDSTGDDFTFVAGDRPPSHRIGLGDLVVAMAAADVKFLVLEISRFLQDDGKILFNVAGNDGSCSVFILPKIL